MEDQREQVPELDKKECRPNFTAVLQFGGFVAFAGGIGVAATSTGILPIVFGSIVSFGGLLTTIAGCKKDWSSLIKCCWPTSNIDNLNRQINEKEDKARNKLSCCLEEARQIQDSKIDIDVNHLKTICESVNYFGQGTRINLQIKEALVEIFKNNVVLLNNERLKNVIPNYVMKRVRQEAGNQNPRAEHSDLSPLIETSSVSASHSNDREEF